ncbi:pancreatic lipase-related protein 2-like [Mizuhopecten yessoensis]|uniref:Pancreatic lipase-related protein 2 n=1 Tax=Mizuhopecten yessoensis TaxID=6573 RepID=A0A210QF86_MIZYE|nr:pancreatic lipase-related protein 2-like [Mizuhopecten yessoensis]OWF47404.1 Pancreatic lipase-related protein 2 [Mizuhopecten yessoensis]
MKPAVVFLFFFLTACYGFILDSVTNRKVCYGELGCFTTDAPFNGLQRPITVVPASPDVIKTQFLLYTRDSPTTADEQVLLYSDASTILSSMYSGSRPTAFIVHGFTHHGHRQWILNMKQALLKKRNINLIVVDWGHGAGIPYAQATANTRVVGAETGMLINQLISVTNTSAADVHVIGHSLGAHIAGYAGDRVQHLGRITGLDPADPYFQGGDPIIRLDATDADFVDVIHTDASSILELGMGSIQQMGHVDFYPNGGKDQPGCDAGLLGKVSHTVWNAVSQLDLYAGEATVACSHERSYELFTESISSSCPFKAYPCTSAAEFDLGHCLRCHGDECSEMGYNSINFAARGSLYLQTQANAPFCNYHYQLNVTGKNNMDGVVTAVLQGQNGNSSPIKLMTDNEVHTQGHTISKFIKIKEDIGEIVAVAMQYDKTSSVLTGWAYPEDWLLMGVSLMDGSTQQLSSFCGYGKTVTNHKAISMGLSGTC